MAQERPIHAPRRPAQTLLELVCASTILALTLTPALRMIRDSMEQGQWVEKIEALNILCISKLEERLCVGAAAWSDSTTTGNFSAEGYSTLKYSLVASQDPASGGMTNQLMAVTATVWDDTNNNDALDSGEPRTTMASKVSKLAKYQSKASGS